MTAASSTGPQQTYLKPDPWKSDTLPERVVPNLKKHIWAAVVIAALIIIPRSVMIVNLQSTTCDEDYHVFRGLMLLRGEMDKLRHYFLNDPAVGEAISAVPALLNGVHLKDNLDVFALPGGIPPGPKNEYTPTMAVRVETAIWKSLLFLPAVAIMFMWLAQVYSLSSAWLCLGMVLAEPTIAAHLPLPTLDVIGMEGILIACWAIWRYAVQPSDGRLAACGVTIGLAMTLKHTAIILPAVFVFLAGVHWLGKLGLWRQRGQLMLRVRRSGYVVLLVLLTIWALFRFDFSLPVVDPLNLKPLWGEMFISDFVLPAGIYVGSVFTGLLHLRAGHPSYLWGQVSFFSWWYYFPALAFYKIPIGLGVVLLVGLFSLFWVKPRYAELPIFLCAIIWLAAMMRQPIGIGFRHFLPCEIFLFMLASRCVAGRVKWPAVLAWLAVASAAVEMVYWAPDYMCYINFPHKDPWYIMSDSNLDWGQSRMEFKKWLYARKDDGRPVYFGYFGPIDVDLYKEMGPRLTQYGSLAHWIHRTTDKPGITPNILPDVNFTMPRHGILVLSPVALTGQYDTIGDHFKPIRDAQVEPEEVIAHNLLVFDLDELYASGKLK